MDYIILLVVISLFVCGFTRCLIFNIHKAIYYCVRDVYEYFKYEKWKEFNLYGIDMFVGMWGHGKTLSATHKARMIYKKYGDSVRFVSNYELSDIPYIPLKNFQQIVSIGKEAFEGDCQYKGTVVLIDEIEDVLSNRNYANFPMQMLNTLTQSRKAHVYIMCTTPCFDMVDIIFRRIVTHVIDCNKYWRLQHMSYYDGRDYMNAVNPQLLKPLMNKWWFVTNADFDSYDTEQMVGETMSADFISNEEHLARIGLDNIVKTDAIRKPSRYLRKLRKKK